MIAELLPDVVHVWYAWLAAPPWPAQALWGLLSDAERLLAGQYAFAADQRAFVLRRGLLRMLLGRYLTRPPATLQLVSSPQGKPELVPMAGQPSLCFNLSQSGDLVLYAIARQPVGIDVEWLLAEHDATALAEWFFGLGERVWLASLPDGQQMAAALRLWTCKEAYVKATGEGITSALGQVSVALDADAIRLLSVAGDAQVAQRWSLQEFMPVPGYVAAVVYRRALPEMPRQEPQGKPQRLLTIQPMLYVESERLEEAKGASQRLIDDAGALRPGDVTLSPAS